MAAQKWGTIKRKKTYKWKIYKGLCTKKFIDVAKFCDIFCSIAVLVKCNIYMIYYEDLLC